MTNFAQFAMRHLLSAAFFLAAFLGAGFLILRPIKSCYEKKHPDGAFPLKRALMWVFFAGYVLVLLFVTCFGRGGDFERAGNLHLFRAFREAWNTYSQQDALNILLNIGMFIPLGFCLPMLHEKLKRWYLPGIVGLLLSGLIESFQYFTARGVLDVDDLFCNSLGAVLGGCLFFSILFLRQKRYKRCALSICPCILSVLILSGTILTYHLKPYGNLPSAPAYRVSTKNIRWNLSCDLPDTPREAMVYKAPSLTKEEADRFAARFSEEHSLDFTEKDRYDGVSLYYDAQENAYLYLLYGDGSYLYQAEGFRGEASQNFDRDHLQKVLEPFGLDIPEKARFYPDAGDNLFLTVRQLPGEGGMYDGSIRCRLDLSGKLIELEQYLLFYREYAKESVLSPKAAFEKLKRGEFSGPQWYSGREAENWTVTGWELSHRLDTKGFYRPVYVFDALIENERFEGGLLVPAM